MHSVTERTETADLRASESLRASLVDRLVAEGDVATPRVIDVLRRTPRHLFIPEVPLDVAYANRALEIGANQTISQPAVVAIMSEALELEGTERVLEVGTGSGYQTAVLAQLAREVFTIERIPELAEAARATLAALGHANVHTRIGDGYLGWPEQAPFDRIVLTASPPEIPTALFEQLVDGGILVGPEGTRAQWLVAIRNTHGVLERRVLGAVSFVAMVPGAR